MRQKISAHVDGGLTGGSSVPRHGSEDSHRRKRKYIDYLSKAAMDSVIRSSKDFQSDQYLLLTTLMSSVRDTYILSDYIEHTKIPSLEDLKQKPDSKRDDLWKDLGVYLIALYSSFSSFSP
jgi:hypothetical protein